MSNSKDTQNEDVMATVTEALPDTRFRVALDGGEEVIVNLSGKMRLHRIRVLVGDRVSIRLDPYGGRGRIIRRF
jgi:translation initiation factor IF-1